MKVITVEEAIRELAYSAKDLAHETGISEGALSKLRNGRQRVTADIQLKFEARYPGYRLIDSTVSIIDEYNKLKISSEKEIKRLKSELRSVSAKHDALAAKHDGLLAQSKAIVEELQRLYSECKEENERLKKENDELSAKLSEIVDILAR